MTPEQLDVLLAIANKGAYLAPSDPSAGFDARAASASDLTAMRTPITPGALVDAGWVRDEAWPRGWYSKSLADNQTLDLCINGRLRFVVNVTGDSFWFCGSNMYDLGELVRLLGGAQ